MVRLTGVLLVLLLIYQLVAQAKVSPNIITREEDPSSGVDCHSRRTLFNIIWGCVSTTIICAWAAIHPNIPPREGPFKGALRRLELMFWTIVAPEILPCWALNQRLAAMTVRDVYNDGKGYEKRRFGIWETVKRWFSVYEIKEAASPAWTVAHGHVLIMGGIHLVKPSGSTRSADSDSNTGIRAALTDVPPTSAPRTEKGQGPSRPEPEVEHGGESILTLEMLRKLVKDPQFKIQITDDGSKGDALSKVIFIMQSSWFILQCLGRWIQGLGLTHLELTTLALASLNGIIFILWWDKPLGAQTLVRMYLKRKLTDSERAPAGRRCSVRSQVIPDFQEAFQHCVATIRDAFLCHSEELVLLPFAILFLLLSPILALAFTFVATVDDLVRRSSTSFPAADNHVPTFYVPRHRYSKWYHMLLLITLGAIFGAIHCSGWNFAFPTYPEQKLWRVASLAVTIIPIAVVPFFFIIDSITSRLPILDPSFPAALSAFLCMLAYVIARLVLLGLALALLRHLPPTAFIAIDWTKFYPHIL